MLCFHAGEHRWGHLNPSGHCSAQGPSKPTEEHPTHEGWSWAQECSSSTPLPNGETWGWGRRDSAGTYLLQEHPTHSARGLWPSWIPRKHPTAKGSLPFRFGAAPGAHSTQRGGTAGADLPLLQPSFTEGQKAAGVQEGSRKPQATAATPMLTQGSPQTEGSVPTQLPFHGAMTPQPRSTPPCPGTPPRPHSPHRPAAAPRCLSLPRAAASPAWLGELGSGRSPGS